MLLSYILYHGIVASKYIDRRYYCLTVKMECSLIHNSWLVIISCFKPKIQTEVACSRSSILLTPCQILTRFHIKIKAQTILYMCISLCTYVCLYIKRDIYFLYCQKLLCFVFSFNMTVVIGITTMCCGCLVFISVLNFKQVINAYLKKKEKEKKKPKDNVITVQDSIFWKILITTANTVRFLYYLISAQDKIY